jgi:adenylate kinase
MLRAAVAAGTPVGLKAKAVMDRGELVSDDIVVGIIADRIEEQDAKSGFILDGFPRTVAQAEAFDAMLAEKGLKLDSVIEFKVNEAELVERIVRRAKDTEARGEPVRKDDNPEVFKTRLEAYRNQTAPLSAYYERTGMLRTVDGMKPIDEVTQAIKEILGR